VHRAVINYTNPILDLTLENFPFHFRVINIWNALHTVRCRLLQYQCDTVSSSRMSLEAVPIPTCAIPTTRPIMRKVVSFDRKYPPIRRTPDVRSAD